MYRKCGVVSAFVVLAFALIPFTAEVRAQSVRFAVIGDFGAGSQNETNVARLVDSHNVSFVATVGDNVYAAGEDPSAWDAIDYKIGRDYHQYIFPYNGRYGEGSANRQNNFFPVLGNHDYGDGGPTDIALIDDCLRGAGAYRSCSDMKGAWYDFFNLPGNERYYSVRRGAVEIFAFSDYYKDPNWDYDNDRNGVIQWLKTALQQSTATWKVVLLHFPPYVSGGSGGNENRRLPYKAWGADAVIAGHSHIYDRLDVNGFPYFVNGAGGRSVGGGNPRSPYSVKLVNNDYGAMIVNADSRSITYEYHTVNGGLQDSYTQTVDEPQPPGPAPRYTWQNVPIGGGGYVLGIDVHPKNNNLVYARTDVGGAYRYNTANDSWTQLLDDIPFDQRGMYGVESLALDANNQDVVYAAVGTRPDICQCDILKSTDQGKTWTAAGLTSVRIAGNSLGRWSGERLGVDPNNSNIVFFASRFDGLWRSEAASAPGSWRRLANATFATSQPAGQQARGALTFVAFDARSGRSRSLTLYAGDYNRGVYKSTDGGNQWALIPGSPKNAERGVVAADGFLYVTSESGVSRLEGNRWTTITPPGGARAFSGVDVSPVAPETVVVAERSTSALGNNRLYRSTDRGQTWREVNRNNVMLDLSDTWGTSSNWSSATADVAIDPANSNRVWLTSWFGVWRTDDFSASPSVWKPIVDGHEELVSHVIISPTEGAPLISGMSDHGGFRHTDPVNLAPEMRLGDIEWRNGRQRLQDTEGLDFAASNPNLIARVGGRYWGPSGDGEYSTDNGRTWNLFTRPATTVQGGWVSVSSDGNAFVWIPQNAPAYASNNLGASWSRANFTPDVSASIVKSRWTPKQLLATDRVLSNTFYMLDYKARRFYRSTDGGFNWQGTYVFSGGTDISNSDWEYQTVKARPDVAGEVWLNSGGSGLFRSTNGGTGFQRVAGVTKALSFDFGAPKPGTQTPTLFLYGKVSGFGNNYRIFRSEDLGATFSDISGSTTIGNGPVTMAGDKQTYGRVYIGTGGRGIFVGRSEGDTPQPPGDAKFAVKPTRVNEGDGFAKVVVTLSRGLANQVTVGYATVPETATRKDDFYGTSGTLTFAPGVTEQSFQVQILDDGLAEGDETIKARLFQTSGPEIAAPSAQITIKDND